MEHASISCYLNEMAFTTFINKRQRQLIFYRIKTTKHMLTLWLKPKTTNNFWMKSNSKQRYSGMWLLDKCTLLNCQFYALSFNMYGRRLFKLNVSGFYVCVFFTKLNWGLDMTLDFNPTLTPIVHSKGESHYLIWLIIKPKQLVLDEAKL